jgi:hypothetical protein
VDNHREDSRLDCLDPGEERHLSWSRQRNPCLPRLLHVPSARVLASRKQPNLARYSPIAPRDPGFNHHNHRHLSPSHHRILTRSRITRVESRRSPLSVRFVFQPFWFLRRNFGMRRSSQLRHASFVATSACVVRRNFGMRRPSQLRRALSVATSARVVRRNFEFDVSRWCSNRSDSSLLECRQSRADWRTERRLEVGREGVLTSSRIACHF